MLVLKSLMQAHGIEQSAIAAVARVSQPTISQLVNHSVWPKRRTAEIRQSISDFLAGRGIDANVAFEEVQAADTACTDNISQTAHAPAVQEGDDNMLMAKQVLHPATRKHFNLFRDPFDDNALQGAEDVFMTPDTRYVREALLQTAKHGGFLAVVGESGAGKSTLRRDLIERINNEHAPVIVIEPYIIAMEDNDSKGKTLKATSIAEAIINTIAPLEGVKRSQEARYRQLHRVLKDSNNAGYSHVLIIEEAHSLPLPTLKHLKRFYELENGFKKLLSIVLVGQPELAMKLSERNQEVREVVQRCEVVNLLPLDTHLEAFLKFKFERINKPITDIFDASAIDAIRARLSNNVGGRKGVVSLLYPLAVSNLSIAAMNLAAEIGAPMVDANVIKGL